VASAMSTSAMSKPPLAVGLVAEQRPVGAPPLKLSATHRLHSSQLRRSRCSRPRGTRLLSHGMSLQDRRNSRPVTAGLGFVE